MSRAGAIGTRLLGVGALVAVGALVWLGLVVPLQTWGNTQKEALSAAQSKTLHVLQSVQNLEAEKQALGAGAEFDGVWSAQNLSEATAKVQATLGDIARQNGISLRSISPLSQPSLPLLEAVAFRIEAEASLDKLVRFLRQAEYSDPILRVEKASVRRLSKLDLSGAQPIVFFQLEVLAPVETTSEGG